MTDLKPKSLRAHTACSLLEPQPKLSLVNRIVELVYGSLFKIKSLFLDRSSEVMSNFPSSKYLQPSNRKSPKPNFLIDLRYSVGIILSVSILSLSKVATIPVIIELVIKMGLLFYH